MIISLISIALLVWLSVTLTKNRKLKKQIKEMSIEHRFDIRLTATQHYQLGWGQGRLDEVRRRELHEKSIRYQED